MLYSLLQRRRATDVRQQKMAVWIPNDSQSRHGSRRCAAPTAMTLRNPSNTSLSARLSSSFLIEAADMWAVGLRASRAASRVRSRAGELVSTVHDEDI